MTRSGWAGCLRRITLALVAVLVVAATLIVFRVPLLRALGGMLVVRDAPARSDVIFLVAGDPSYRPVRAAELYRAGYAPRIVTPRSQDLPAAKLGLEPNYTDIAAGMLMRHGVPDTAIVVLETPGGSTSTYDDVRMFAVYARRHDIHSVLVVTSTFHTRRTRWLLRRALHDMPVQLRLIPTADPRYDVKDWWRNEEGYLAFIEEYLKFLHEFVRR